MSRKPFFDFLMNPMLKSSDAGILDIPKRLSSIDKVQGLNLIRERKKMLCQFQQDV